MMMPIFGLEPPDVMILFKPIGAQPGEHGVALEILQPLFLHRGQGRRARMLRPPGGMTKSAGTIGAHAIERDVDRGRRFNSILHAFKADPAAGEAAHRIAVKPVIDDLLHARRR